MDFKWRPTNYGSWQLFWDERTLRCAELSLKVGRPGWSVVLSHAIAPMDFVFDGTRHNTLEEAKEHTENLVRVLIIGGHHERI
ncbi:hypothetical protein UFOVP48_19 [uncultured Caudovirales phage]|uniref:Uncharacterized protein n=1 Tax=uncultured Caudovirales phage TaxID=2100421 RepID=A0A6J5KMJ5_9CAUD|nr:hypothetical protein UFOVP48_19 [uncultured Caudovirales phage]